MQWWMSCSATESRAVVCEDPVKILIVKMSAIGDVIHALPALNALRHRFPNAHITWLTEKAASAVVEGHPALDRVIVSDRKNWLKGLPGEKGLKNLRQIFYFVRTLRDTTYDIVIDFQGLMKSAAMVGLSKGRRKIGYNRTREFSYLVLDERVQPFDMDKHAIFRYLNLAKYLKADTASIRFDVPMDTWDEGCVISGLRQHGWSGQSIVAVNPMSKWETKLWAREKFSELADRLIEEHGCFVVFTGNTEDRKDVSDMVGEMRQKCGNLSGKTDLRQLAALYKMSRCVIATDTGPMHLAAAVGTPVVALFGATAPWRTGPFGKGHEVVHAGWPCSPCFRKRCDTRECMSHISVDQVFDAVTRLFNRVLMPKTGGTIENDGDRSRWIHRVSSV